MGKPTDSPRGGGIWSEVFGPWVWEIVSSAASSALLTAIIVILTRVDGQAQEDWRLQITLNTLINVLSTLFRACLASTAAEIISQQKWIWFWSAPAPGRPIRHIQSFDAGSRSLLGSLKLLPVVATRYPLAILPVVILLSSLFIGPFAQQSIRTVYRDLPSDFGTASLPASNRMNSSDPMSFFRTRGRADFIMWSLQPEPRSDLFKSVSISSSNDFAINWTCPTANCDFPVLAPGSDVTHTSLGVCSSCTDVTSLVEKGEVEGSTNYTLPNDMQLIAFDTQAHMAVSSGGSSDWAAKAMAEEERALARWAFVNTTVLTLALAPGQSDADQQPTTPVAVTCSLYPCLRSYAAKVRDSKLLERVVDSTPLVPDLGDYAGADAEEKAAEYTPGLSDNDGLAAIQSPCKIGSDIYAPANASQAPDTRRVRLFAPGAAPDYPATLMPESCIARIDRFGHAIIGVTYSKFLNGSCGWDARQGPFAECGEEWWLAKFWEEKRATSLTISDRFGEMAEAMTNKIRLGYMRPGGAAEPVRGMTVRRVAFVHIDWAWLVLPMALLALDMAVLAAMVVHSVRHRRREAVWKSNPLPLLYYKAHFAGLEEPDRLSVSTGYDPLETAAGPDPDRLMTSAQLEAVAATVRVRLRRGASPPDATTGQVEPVDVEGNHGETRPAAKPAAAAQEREVLLSE